MIQPQSAKFIFFAGLLLVALGMVSLSPVVKAAPADPQGAYPSPTPGPDGRIIYIVKSGDTCSKIELLYGVTENYLIATNKLDSSCSLLPGQSLVLGMGASTASSPTPGPSPTATLIQPTATPIVGGTADVCVLVYDDINGDGLRQPSEPAIAGAAVSLTNLDGSYSKTITTVLNPDSTVYQGMCLTPVPMGKYNVSAAAPDGYNPTVDMTSTLDVTPGGSFYINFGAQPKAAPATVNTTKSTSPLLGLVGAVFLLAGIGMGIYVWRIMVKK